MNVVLTKLVTVLRRDRALPVSVIAAKVKDNLSAFFAARMLARICDQVGPRARVFGGRPRIDNEGRIDLGADFSLSCTFGTVHLATAERGVIDIGESVSINYGTSVSARTLVCLGDRVKIGPYCILSDSDVPLPLPLSDGDGARAIVIGNDVWLGARVTVLPGARIGDGSVISAGSIVAGEIPPNAIASGNPARVLRVASTPPPPPLEHAGTVERSQSPVSGVRDARPKKAPDAAVG